MQIPYLWSTISLSYMSLDIGSGNNFGAQVVPPPGYDLHSWQPGSDPGVIIVCWKLLEQAPSSNSYVDAALSHLGRFAENWVRKNVGQ